MQIEIWSDLICPFCGIGNRRLDNALAGFAHADEVKVVHRSFQLDPNAPVGQTRSVKEMLRAKYNLTDEQFRSNTASIEASAQADGLVPYIVADNQTGNTALAHELLAYAADNGREAEGWNLLYKEYFGAAGDIFSLDALVDLGAQLGLEREGVRAALTDRRYAKRVRDDAAQAQQFGARGVPFIVIDRRYAIAGAQPLSNFVETIEAAWRDAHPELKTVGGEDASCGPDGCAI